MLGPGPLFVGENARELRHMVRNLHDAYTAKIFYLLLERLEEQERLLNDTRSRLVRNGLWEVREDDEPYED